jgi:hypothetical protein
MTAGMVHATAGMGHVTNLTPPGSDNPSSSHGTKHQSMTARMDHTTASMDLVTKPSPRARGARRPAVGSHTARTEAYRYKFTFE